MKIIFKPKFQRDTDKVKSLALLVALQEKIAQIKLAKDLDEITGIKKLRGYETHYRIYVKTEKLSYRIGAIVRGNTIWLVRFLPRKIIYTLFP